MMHFTEGIPTDSFFPVEGEAVDGGPQGQKLKRHHTFGGPKAVLSAFSEPRGHIRRGHLLKKS